MKFWTSYLFVVVGMLGGSVLATGSLHDKIPLTIGLVIGAGIMTLVLWVKHEFRE